MRILYGTILVAYLPLFWAYLNDLTRDEEYRFAPVAWIVTAILFFHRRGARSDARLSTSRHHTGFDVTCLIIAYATWQPSVAVLCAWVWLHSFFRTQNDRQVQATLAYLCAIPLLTVRPPFGGASWLMERLNSAATMAASRLLDVFEIVHVRNSGSIEVPGNLLSVDQIGAGVLSIPCFMCLAVTLLVIQRRRWPHALTMLSCAFGFAILMNAVRLHTAALLWLKYGVDASVGSAFLFCSLTGYLFATLLFWSLDMLLAFLTEPVPFMNVGGINPVSVLWNSAFLALPVVEPVGAATEAQQSGMPKFSRIFEASAAVPGGILVWIREFVYSWFATRSMIRLCLGIPMLIFTAVAVSWWSGSRSPQELNDWLADSLQAADIDQQPDEARLLTARLLQANTTDKELRFQLALQLISQDRIDEAKAHLASLTLSDRTGYSPARMWLVKNADGPAPVIPLNPEQRKIQLRQVVSETPDNAEAHLLLATAYQQQEQFLLAEQHLIRATEISALSAPDLMLLQLRLGRSTEDIERHVSRPCDQLHDQLIANPGNLQARISCARIHALRGQFAVAEELLRDGLSIADAPEIRATLSNVYTQQAGQLLSRPLGANAAAVAAVKAVTIDPANAFAVDVLLKCVARTNPVHPEELATAIEFWRQRVARQTDSESPLRLAQLLIACGTFEEAVEVLRPVVDQRPELRIQLARILSAAGRNDEAIDLTMKLEREVRSQLVDAPDDQSLKTSLCRLLLMQNRATDAMQQVDALIAETGPRINDKLAAVYVEAIVAVFDESHGTDPSFARSPEALLLLRKVFAVRPGSAQAMSRLARLSFQDGEAGRSADAFLAEVLAESGQKQDGYFMLGTEAILQDEFDRAAVYLERAISLSPTSPRVLNNLAVALVRKPSPEPARALDLIESALSQGSEYPELLATRAEVFIALDRWNDALVDLEVVLQRVPEHALARQLLAKTKQALHRN